MIKSPCMIQQSLGRQRLGSIQRNWDRQEREMVQASLMQKEQRQTRMAQLASRSNQRRADWLNQ